MKLVLPSFAKVNLNLRVLGRRKDGFHELETVFQTINLSDSIQFELEKEGINLEVPGLAVPADSSNLIYRAARCLFLRTKPGAGIRIKLYKNIPVGGGLGGGSSNAALTLLALNQIWQCGLNQAQLQEIADLLGSDVAFFFFGGTAFGSGRGNRIQPMSDLPPTRLILVTPNIRVSTPEIYQALQLTPDLQLTTSDMDTKIRRFQDIWSRRDWIELKNDLETVAFSRYPILAEMKESLQAAGCEHVMISGSGSSLYAINSSENILNRLRKMDILKSAQITECRTLSGEEFRGEFRNAFLHFMN